MEVLQRDNALNHIIDQQRWSVKSGFMDAGHDQPPRYRAYLLRCWEVRTDRPGQPGAWRFRLEDVETGERRGFAGLAAVVAFLEQEVGGSGGGT
jgi:hypothetical protein